MKKVYAAIVCALLVGMVLPASLYAQQRRTVSGVVTDAEGTRVAGASIMIEGTTEGATSDAEGRFTVNVAPEQALIVSFVGFETQRIVPGARTRLDIALNPELLEVGEVVVTALGIERDTKSLGYAVQSIDGDKLVERRELNITNALSGEVAGLQVVRSSQGPAASSKIVLRGNNSLTGDNQPLIVVDGTPIDNGVGSINNDIWNPLPDMGNGLSDINAEDIASISVLKGGSAAALYGSRAGNGVILITTKTGRQQEGLGITLSSTFQSTSPFMMPKQQSEFGQGTLGNYDSSSTLSWGPRIEGQTVTDWRGEEVQMRAYDNLKNFINNGTNLTESITFQNQFGRTSFYTSLARTDDKGMVPGSKYGRTNLTAHAVSAFGKDDRWTLDTKVQYIRAKAQNRPLSGLNADNSYYTMYNLPRSLDVTTLDPSVDELGKMIWWQGETSTTMNPYWMAKYDQTSDIRERYLLSGALKYRFTEWLNGEIRAGLDSYTTTYENKRYAGNPNQRTGRYSFGHDTFHESNMSFLFSGGKDYLWDKLGVNATLGGNMMERGATRLYSSVGGLVVPNLFSLNNGLTAATVDETPRYGRKKMNSLYGSAQLNWDQWLFLDATLRNDWTSTLSKNNRSYLYPSVSVSYVFTDMAERYNMNLPSWLSFGKLRASYAEVGNDMEAYNLYNTYSIGKDPNGNTTADSRYTLYHDDVKNENIRTFEVGGQFRFFEDRVGLDVAWYKSNATNQLIAIPRDPMSGYSSELVNAGNIQNKGLEIMADARILERPTGFSWDLGANLSFNRNTVKDLGAIGTIYQLGGYERVQVLAVEGGDYGEIWGRKYLRVDDPDSEFNGQLLLDENGLPQGTDEAYKLGTQQASALLGVTNSFSYKGFGLSFLVDARFGGKIFSATNAYMQANGTAKRTAENGRADMVVGGVVSDKNGGYVANDKTVTAQQYWTAVAAGGSNLGINEFNTYDATNIRLRNIQLSYSFNKKQLAKTPFQAVKLGVSCNNVWMLKSHLNGVDPESVYAIGTNATGFESFAPPTVRTLMFNVTLGF